VSQALLGYRSRKSDVASLFGRRPMQKINIRDVTESATASPKGKFGRANKDISIALGRQPDSADLSKRHPFDVQICRIPSGKSRCPYHAHTAQWEFYHIISGSGTVRHQDGLTKVEKDDAFMFAPEEPHQIINDGSEDLVLYIVADNPVGESCYYPDSKKWFINAQCRQIVRSDSLDYFDGEE
jgi:uncharacterized cupin superfamily protein